MTRDVYVLTLGTQVLGASFNQDKIREKAAKVIGRLNPVETEWRPGRVVDTEKLYYRPTPRAHWISSRILITWTTAEDE